MYNPYEDLIRSKTSRLSNIGATIPNVSQNINKIQSQSEGLMRRRNLPTSSIYSLQKENEQAASNAYLQTAVPIYQENARRKDLLRSEIEELTVKSKQLEEAQKEKEKEEKKAKNRSWVKLGGAAIGAAVGTVIAPGIGTSIGASIGSGLGTAAAGAGVGQGNIDRVFSEEYSDPMMMAEGLVSTATSVASAIPQIQGKKLADTMGKYGEQFAELSAEEQQKVMNQVGLQSSLGNFSDATSYLENYFTQSSQPPPQVPQPTLPQSQETQSTWSQSTSQIQPPWEQITWPKPTWHNTILRRLIQDPTQPTWQKAFDVD